VGHFSQSSVAYIARFLQAHAHHYTDVDGFSADEFSLALHSLDDLIGEYNTLDKQLTNPPPAIPRLTAIV
jgi:hypothetical protein